MKPGCHGPDFRRAHERTLPHEPVAPDPLRPPRGGWTVETLAERGVPALKELYPLDRSADVFCWDPI